MRCFVFVPEKLAGRPSSPLAAFVRVSHHPPFFMQSVIHESADVLLRFAEVLNRVVQGAKLVQQKIERVGVPTRCHVHRRRCIWLP